MFENFSLRAKKVVIVTRLEAGQRGADSIDVNDLVAGLITEDQDMTSLDLNEQDPHVKEFLEKEPKPMGVLFPLAYSKKRERFFPSEVAANLLAKLKEILPLANSIHHTTAMETSPGFETVIRAAKQLQHEFHQRKVHPLHLLAAALREPCEASRMLQAEGITEERVLQLLRSGNDL
jgi:ATP-dependent Clp protease ATP-binding subunit ClpA